MELETGLSQKKLTNAEGYYRFPGLAVGRYSVTVTSDKFKTQVINDVTLRIGETRTLNVALQVGTANEHMQVDAVLTPAEKTSPEAATVIDTEQIETNGRDWASFTLLAPFAQDDGGGDQRTIRFAGRARDDNNFQFDGVDAGGIHQGSRFGSG